MIATQLRQNAKACDCCLRWLCNAQRSQHTERIASRALILWCVPWEQWRCQSIHKWRTYGSFLCAKWRIEWFILYSFLIRYFFLSGRTLKNFRAWLVKCDLKKLLLQRIALVYRLQYFVVSGTVGFVYLAWHIAEHSSNCLDTEFEQSVRMISDLSRRKMNPAGCVLCQVYKGLHLLLGKWTEGSACSVNKSRCFLFLEVCVSERVQLPTDSWSESYWLALSVEDTIFHLSALSINFSFFVLVDVLASRKEKGVVRVKQMQVISLFPSCMKNAGDCFFQFQALSLATGEAFQCMEHHGKKSYLCISHLHFDSSLYKFRFSTHPIWLGKRVCLSVLFFFFTGFFFFLFFFLFSP